MVISLRRCPKCSGKMIQEDYLYCPYCGFTNYSMEKHNRIKIRHDALRGNVHFVRYGGSLRNNVNKTIKIKLSRGDNIKGTPDVVAECPFCDEKMQVRMLKRQAQPMTIKRGKRSFKSFKCSKGHAIFIDYSSENFIWT